MLKIENLHVYYGGIHALQGINLEVPDRQIISLIGANGAGKSTTLKAIMSLVSKPEGHIEFDGVDITKMETRNVVKQGVVLCPEGRRVFPDLTVEENVLIGLHNSMNYSVASSMLRLPKYWKQEKEAGH